MRKDSISAQRSEKQLHTHTHTQGPWSVMPITHGWFESARRPQLIETTSGSENPAKLSSTGTGGMFLNTDWMGGTSACCHSVSAPPPAGVPRRLPGGSESSRVDRGRFWKVKLIKLIHVSSSRSRTPPPRCLNAERGHARSPGAVSACSSFTSRR